MKINTPEFIREQTAIMSRELKSIRREEAENELTEALEVIKRLIMRGWEANDEA